MKITMLAACNTLAAAFIIASPAVADMGRISQPQLVVSTSSDTKEDMSRISKTLETTIYSVIYANDHHK